LAYISVAESIGVSPTPTTFT